MIKVLRNLKETWVYVVIIVLLLCIQAWADLTLPDYTSKIVNTGIQARWNRKCFSRCYNKRIYEYTFTIY